MQIIEFSSYLEFCKAFDFDNNAIKIHSKIILRENELIFKVGSWRAEIYINSKRYLHREGGPAYITRSSCIWYKNGLKHRACGPAVIDDAVRSYYLEGKRLDRASFFETLSRREKFKAAFNLDEW